MKSKKKIMGSTLAAVGFFTFIGFYSLVFFVHWVFLIPMFLSWPVVVYTLHYFYEVDSNEY